MKYRFDRAAETLPRAKLAALQLRRVFGEVRAVAGRRHLR